MKTKLTLSLEQTTIERAKDYAAAHDKSVSQIVGDYFDALTARKKAPSSDQSARGRPLPQAVQQLIGAGAGEADESDYYRHLEHKYR